MLMSTLEGVSTVAKFITLMKSLNKTETLLVLWHCRTAFLFCFICVPLLCFVCPV